MISNAIPYISIILTGLGVLLGAFYAYRLKVRQTGVDERAVLLSTLREELTIARARIAALETDARDLYQKITDLRGKING